MTREPSEREIAMVTADSTAGQTTHFNGPVRGQSLCGFLHNATTTSSAVQTTCVACLRILVSHGKDAEAALRKITEQKK